MQQARISAPGAAARGRPWTAALRACLAASLALWLAACGPGVGGTGTGTGAGSVAPGEALAPFGAEAASVCESDIADQLACSTAAPGRGEGTATLWFAEAEPASQTLLALDGQQAELQLRCEGLEFAGLWGTVAGQRPRYYGIVRMASGDAPASLAVARAPTGLTITLQAPDGRELAPPRTLERVAAPTTPAACR